MRSPFWSKTLRIAFGLKGNQSCTVFVDSHNSLRHCMISRPHLQSIAIDTWQTHGPHDHGAGWYSQLNPTTRNSKWSRLWSLKNGVPQGSVREHLLLNIYTSTLLTTVSRIYAYADVLAIMHAVGDWQVFWSGAEQRHAKRVGGYLHNLKLNLSTKNGFGSLPRQRQGR